jgi:multidrug efflux pump subunit AcrA (membrane-fusion protein)
MKSTRTNVGLETGSQAGMPARHRFTVLLLAACLLAGCNSKTAEMTSPKNLKETKAARDEVILSPAQQTTARIETQAAVMSNRPDLLLTKGRIALPDDGMWSIGVRTIGLVVAVYANLGDYVKKGQVLARYHADEVREERAHYRTAIAELERARAAVAQAQRNRDRAQRLLDLKAGSVQHVEQAQQELVNAQSAVKRAEIEVDRGKDLLEDDLRVAAVPPPGQDEILDDVPILAPESGYIIQKNISPGKTVELSAVTFLIGDLSKVWMLASVRQEDLPGLHLGQSATVILPGEPQQRFAGKIANLGQEIDRDTRMMQVRIALENPQNRLKPEMLADAEIPLGRSKSVLTIPSDAIQQVNGQDVVFVRTAPDHFAVRAVRVDETSGGQTPVHEGIQAGDRVVVRGSFILKSQLLKATLDSE